MHVRCSNKTFLYRGAPALQTRGEACRSAHPLLHCFCVGWLCSGIGDGPTGEDGPEDPSLFGRCWSLSKGIVRFRPACEGRADERSHSQTTARNGGTRLELMGSQMRATKTPGSERQVGLLPLPLSQAGRLRKIARYTRTGEGVSSSVPESTMSFRPIGSTSPTFRDVCELSTRSNCA